MSAADDDSRHGGVMAVCYATGALGVAVLQADKLLLLQQHESSEGAAKFQTLSLAVASCEPAQLVVSSRCHDALRQHVELLARQRGSAARPPASVQVVDALDDSASQLLLSDDGQEGAADWVSTEMASSFQYRKAASRLLSVLTPAAPPGCVGDAAAHRAWLASQTDLDARLAVSAGGGLLAALLSRGAIQEDEDGRIHLQGVGELKLAQLMRIDDESARALHIFHSDAHPSLMGIGGTKEGFSLFAMMDAAVTAPGHRQLRAWFQRPVTTLPELSERQDGVAFFVHHREARAQLRQLLKQVGDPAALLKRCVACNGAPAIEDVRKMAACLATLQLLAQALSHLLDVPLPPDGTEALSALPASQGGGLRAPLTQQQQQQQSARIGGTSASSPSRYNVSSGTPAVGGASQGQLPGQVVRRFRHLPVAHIFPAGSVEAFERGAFLIDSVFDLEGAAAIGIIKTDLSFGGELDALKATFACMEDFLDKVAEAEVAKIPPFLSRMYPGVRLSCHYSPHAGYLLFSAGGPLPADLLEDCFPDYREWAHEIDADGVEGVFYHADVTAELEAEVGDVRGKIRDFEDGVSKRVMLKLAAIVKPAICVLGEGLAALDALTALADACELHKFVRPKLTEKDELIIDRGWHPLSAALVDTFVPNDTRMPHCGPRIQVITGPNCSGKSLYAKQVALIVFLAHVGAFVPAASATVGITDAILTRLGGDDADGSSFAADLCGLSAMLARCGPRSLLILDEFGKGTLPADGKALLLATLSHLSLRSRPPKVVCTTHFLEVLDATLLPRNPQIETLTMDTLVPEGAGDLQRITFLFKLKSGAAMPSFGLECAARADAPEHVVARMRAVQRSLLNRHACPRRPLLAPKLQRAIDVAQRLQHAGPELVRQLAVEAAVHPGCDQAQGLVSIREGCAVCSD